MSAILFSKRLRTVQLRNRHSPRSIGRSMKNCEAMIPKGKQSFDGSIGNLPAYSPNQGSFGNPSKLALETGQITDGISLAPLPPSINTPRNRFHSRRRPSCRWALLDDGGDENLLRRIFEAVVRASMDHGLAKAKALQLMRASSRLTPPLG